MGRTKKLDFTGVESFARCSEGVHTAKLIEIEETVTQAGDDMLKATFEVVSGQEKGCRVFDNFTLSDKALWKLKQFLVAAGVKADGKVAVDLDKLIGKVCDITVIHEEYNGVTRAKISDYQKLIKLAKAADMEDYDEIEEDDEEEVEEVKPAKKAKPAPAKAVKSKPAPEPVEETEDEDWEDDDEEEEAPPAKPAKKTKPEPKAKPKAKPAEDEDEDEDDDWEDA
jgi:hypothetical protein